MAKETSSDSESLYAHPKGPYKQKSVSKRIEALFLDNLGKIVTSTQIREVAKDPDTGESRENWHQRLSELRTDKGYTILSWRDRSDLTVEQYVMPTAILREKAAGRVTPTKETWAAILKRSGNCCEWNEAGQKCALKQGDIDPVGGGRVRLTADHKSPHSVNPKTDVTDASQWQALCGRHQVMKKNFWDNTTGKLNVYSIVQAATRTEKEAVFEFLLEHFRYVKKNDGTIEKI